MGLDVGELHALDGLHAIAVGVLLGGVAQLDTNQPEPFGLTNPRAMLTLALSNRT